MVDIENPMVVDSHWRHLEKPEPKIIGECAGCGEDITADQNWYEFDNEELIHQDSVCCWEFVANKSRCCGPEE